KKYDWYFIHHGFCNEKGILREELITTEAKEIAGDFKNVTSTQLRAFFGEVKGFRNRILGKEEETQQEEFEKIYPLILMIKSKINYRNEKEKKKLSPLKQFLDAGIERIQKENKLGRGCKAFLDFSLFFETIVGYFGDMK
ncbi:hypothetical protein FUSO6_12675, partial [Fusobacterium necrophorum DAB]